MFCDRCGAPFVGGSQYCTACGKPILGGAAGVAAVGTGTSRTQTDAYAARSSGDGRVGRNINLLAGLWLANGILRLMGLGWLIIFRRLFFDDGWGSWHLGGWPFNWGPFMTGGILFGGAALAFFGMIHLLLAWSLYERQSWARTLGIVMGVLALVRLPFGTALGIYTLWVLLPEGSAKEYDGMAGLRGRVNAASYSA